jgi:cell division septation protein DedD
MEDQTTWKGHGFTLLVFAGIVVLCSIFFILGMLVGRTQGQKIAMAAAEPGPVIKGEAKVAPAGDRPELTFYESVEKEKLPALEAPPAKEDEPAESGPPPKPARPSPPAIVINYQIAALRQAADADKLLDEVKKKGFRGFILAPASGDANPFYRVQVGPFSDMIEAEDAKKKLEATGYQPILRK